MNLKSRYNIKERSYWNPPISEYRRSDDQIKTEYNSQAKTQESEAAVNMEQVESVDQTADIRRTLTGNLLARKERVSAFRFNYRSLGKPDIDQDNLAIFCWHFYHSQIQKGFI